VLIINVGLNDKLTLRGHRLRVFENRVLRDRGVEKTT
jgi:hypothetical protein